MGIGEDFNNFCSNLVVGGSRTISDRRKNITRRLNWDFWNLDSDDSHSFYTSSYGRGTAINRTSDVDLIMEMPFEVYQRFNAYSVNGQSALLQEVRDAIRRTYSGTDVGADGQVVIVPFTDGIVFEVLPAFKRVDGSYTFPDTNDDGRWRIADPKSELIEFSDADYLWNGNLKHLCRMARARRECWGVDIGGFLIDTLAFKFLESWEYRGKEYLYYDFMSCDFFEYLSQRDKSQKYWFAPGSSEKV